MFQIFVLTLASSIDFNLIIAFAQLGGFDINDILDSGSLTAINNNENSNGTSGTVVPSSTILWWQTMRPTAHRNSRSLYKKSAAVAAAQLNLSGNTTKNYTYTYSSSADDEWKNLFYELKKLQTWLDNSHPVLECYIEVCKASSSSSPLTTRKFQSRDDADPVATILAETRVRSNTITEFHQHTTHHIHRLLSGSSIDDSNTQRVLQTLSLENGQRNFGSSGKTVRLMRLGHGIMGTGYNFDAEDGVGSPPLKYRRLKIQAIRLALLMWSVTVLTSKHLPRRSSWVGDWSNSSSTYDSPTSIPSSPRSPHAMISPRGSIGGRGGASSPFGGSGIGISQGNIIGGVGVGGGGGAGSASSSASTAVGAASNPLAAAVATTPTAPIAGHPAANMSNYQNHLAAQFEILRQLDTSTLGSLVLLLEATHQLLRQRFIKEGMDGREAMFHAFQTVSMGPGVVGLVLNPDVGGGGSVKAFNGSSNIYHQNYSFSNNTAVTSHNGVGNGGGVAPLLRNNLVVSNESLMRRGSESRIRSTSTTSRNNSNNNNNSYGRIHGSSIFVRDLIRNNPSLRPNAGPFLINTVFGVLAERGIFSM